MKRAIFVFVLSGALSAACANYAQAQTAALGPRVTLSTGDPLRGPDIDLPSNVVLPRMAPELAFEVYSRRMADQATKLAEYTDRTIVQAELPDTKQSGEYELVRNYKAPKSLKFATIKFTGDNFVKSNVITRLLQSEVDHVEKGDPSETAISEKNYKISYKGVENINEHPVHVFQLKPRRKIPGLFKGKLYLDVHTGSLRRIEGSAAKSPSFFVKKIEFTQDFEDINGFTVPTELRSVSKARIIGRAIVRIFHRGYQLKAAQEQPAPEAAPSQQQPVASVLGGAQ